MQRNSIRYVLSPMIDPGTVAWRLRGAGRYVSPNSNTNRDDLNIMLAKWIEHTRG